MVTDNVRDVRPVLRAGDLAYYDSLTDMIPCKVISIRGVSGVPSYAQRVTVKVTARKGSSAFKNGEEFDAFGFRVVPRAAYFPRRYGASIGYYTVEVSQS